MFPWDLPGQRAVIKKSLLRVTAGADLSGTCRRGLLTAPAQGCSVSTPSPSLCVPPAEITSKMGSIVLPVKTVQVQVCVSCARTEGYCPLSAVFSVRKKYSFFSPSLCFKIFISLIRGKQRVMHPAKTPLTLAKPSA